MKMSAKKFVKLRDKYLAAFDLEGMRRLCARNKIEWHRDPCVAEIAMHKARVHAINVPVEKRLESYDWLTEKGYDPMATREWIMMGGF